MLPRPFASLPTVQDSTMAIPDIPLRVAERVLTTELGLAPLHLEILKPGAWSAAFAFEADGAHYVIRFSHHRDDFERDAFAARFAAPCVPVPTVTHLGEHDGIAYAVSERATGAFIDTLSGEEFRQVLPSLLETLNALRIADLAGTHGFGGWDSDGNGTHASWREFLLDALVDRPGERGGGWRPRLEQSATGAAAFDRDILVLERLLAAMPETRHVLHSDLINYNCFVHDRRISGIIDWGCALYGDFVYEVAWFTFWWPWYPQWSGIDLAQEALAFYRDAGADVEGFSERLTCYELQIGLAHQAYNAFVGNWTELDNVTRHTTAVADRVR
jgi:hygromycin-B 4-O-kinase